MKRMQWTDADAVAAAVAYADIFDYPLTEEGLQLWLPLKKGFKRPRPASWRGEALVKGIHRLTVAGIAYYSLRRGRSLIKVRDQRARWSIRKWSRARWAGRLLQLIPSITLVGVTGGLAMHNTKQEDDVDLFVVASSGTLWVTRLLATLLMDMVGVRRKPSDTRYTDKICLNMFMSESALTLPRTEQDLFASHEVLQMVPLWERGGAYQKFLRANRWVRKFLPNAWDETHQKLRTNKTYKIIRPLDFVGLFRLFEPFTRVAQFWYMKRRRTTEVVSRQMIRFHPVDARVWVKRVLQQRLLKFNIPLDKVFYGR